MGLFDEIFGSKPDVANYTPTNLGVESGKAIGTDIANQPDIEKLLERILPGYGDMLAQGSKNTQSMLKGQIPKDVQDQVRRGSAYQSLMGGFGGSGMSKALTARDFGLTSLSLMDQGTNAAQRWTGIAQGANAPYMVTPGQQADTTFKNNLYQQITDQFKYNVAAQPDPAVAGIFNTLMTLMAQDKSIAGGIVGGGSANWGGTGSGGGSVSGGGGGGGGGGGMAGGASLLGGFI